MVMMLLLLLLLIACVSAATGAMTYAATPVNDEFAASATSAAPAVSALAYPTHFVAAPAFVFSAAAADITEVAAALAAAAPTSCYF